MPQSQPTQGAQEPVRTRFDLVWVRHRYLSPQFRPVCRKEGSNGGESALPSCACAACTHCQRNRRRYRSLHMSYDLHLGLDTGVFGSVRNTGAHTVRSARSIVCAPDRPYHHITSPYQNCTDMCEPHVHPCSYKCPDGLIRRPAQEHLKVYNRKPGPLDDQSAQNCAHDANAAEP